MPKTKNTKYALRFVSTIKKWIVKPIFLDLFIPSSPIRKDLKGNIQIESRKGRRHRFIWIFLFLLLGYSSAYIARELPKTLTGIIVGKLAILTKTEYGTVVAAGIIAYGISKFFLSTVADRSHSGKMLGWGLILSGGLNIIMGLFFTPFFLHFKTVMLLMITILSFFIGWFQGACVGAIMRSFRHWWKSSNRGKWFAIWSASLHIGPAILLGTILFTNFTLKKILNVEKIYQIPIFAFFLTPSIVVIIIGILCVFLLADTPESAGFELEEDIATKEEEKEIKTQQIVSEIVGNRMIWILGIAKGAISILTKVPTVWIIIYLYNIHHVTIEKGIWGISFFEVPAIIGTIGFGLLLESVLIQKSRLIGKKKFRLLFIVVLLHLPGLIFLTIAKSYFFSILGFALLGTVAYIPYIFTSLFSFDFIHKKTAATSVGFQGLFTYFSSSVLGTIILGRLIGGASGMENNYIWLFIFFWAAWLVLAICILLLINIEVKQRFKKE